LFALLSVRSSGETYCAVPTKEFLPEKKKETKRKRRNINRKL